MFTETKVSFRGESKKVFILIHGLTGSPGEFIPYVRKLLQYGDLHLISLPGHGKLQFNKQSDYSYQSLIDSFARLVESCKKKDMIFVCHSLGSFLINDNIFSSTQKKDRFFFISPVINEKLNPKLLGKTIRTITNKDKRFNLKDLTNKDLQTYYKKLTSYIYSNPEKYTAQKNLNDKRIFNLSGNTDKLLLSRENHIHISGGHNIHIDNPDEILRIIEDRL